MKAMLTKFPMLALMFIMNHGGDKMLLMGSTTIHQDLHKMGLHGYVNKMIALDRPKDVMVYARGINHE